MKVLYLHHFVCHCLSLIKTILLAPEGGSSHLRFRVNLDLKYDLRRPLPLSITYLYSVHVSPSAAAVSFPFIFRLFLGINPSSVFLSQRLFCWVKKDERIRFNCNKMLL